MISEFPPDYELIGFFNAEPHVLDSGVPWIYNTLTWALNRGDTHLRCSISPSYGQAQLVLTVIGKEVLDITIYNVDRINLEKRVSEEVLCMTRGSGEDRDALVLRLDPDIHIATSIG